MYECGRKCIRSLFKEYKDALPEEEGSTGFLTFCNIVKLLTLRGESKSGLSTYYKTFRHGKNVFFNHMLDRIVEWI